MHQMQQSIAERSERAKLEKLSQALGNYGLGLKTFRHSYHCRLVLSGTVHDIVSNSIFGHFMLRLQSNGAWTRDFQFTLPWADEVLNEAGFSS